jgi:hypothetical protein
VVHTAPKGLFGIVLEMLSVEIVNPISLDEVNQRPVESGAARGDAPGVKNQVTHQLAGLPSLCAASSRTEFGQIQLQIHTLTTHSAARRLASTDLAHCYTNIVIKLRKGRGKLLSPHKIRALHIADRRKLVRRAF